jgi:hypothetical protein
MSRSSLVVIVLCLIFAARVLLSARARRTEERHTLSWLAICAVVIGLAVWREGIDQLAHAMGIFYAPSALFLLVSGAMLWLLYRQSVALDEARDQLRRLAQEVALRTAPPPPRSEP